MAEPLPPQPESDLNTDSVSARTLSVEVGGEPAEAPAANGPSTPHAVLRTGDGRKYEIGRVLAEGGMGTIYQARDLNCRREVAMKIMHSRLQAQPHEMLGFIEEAQIASQLEHPNIVPVHDLGVDAEGRVFYTMKYVKGVTLSDVLEALRAGRQEVVEAYPLARLLTIYQKACDAVAFAHSKGVIHRDLKPANIMIGDYGEVLVMDWGLARVQSCSGPANPRELAVDTVARDQPESARQAAQGWVVGTPGFMSPEQARAGAVDQRSDIYSLGAILYAILTLRPPVKGDTLKRVLDKVERGEIAAPLSYNLAADAQGRPLDFPHCPDRKIPAVLSDVAMKAMAVAPGDRYPTVKDLQREVESYQDGLVWHLVADEDFSNADFFTRWEVYGGHCELHDGELRLFGGEPQFLLLKKPLPGDVRIDFECRQESVYLNDIACFMSAIRSPNWKEIPTSGYEFKYGAFSNSLNILARANNRLWAEAAAPLVRGQRYQVRAERVGSRLRLQVNGAEVFRVTDADPLSGPDRMAAGLLGWMADTRYTRVRVFTLGTPWKADVLDIAERHLHRGHYGTAMDLFQEVMDAGPDSDRLERARKGFETARNRDAIFRNLPLWRERLEKSWPGVKFNLRMDNDGLTVDVSNTGISDLEPLRGLPLTSLYCSDNRIVSLEPLRGLPLVVLNCGNNPITSLEPLRGMPLVTLLCEGCPVTSLEPLRGLPLTMINCGGARLGPDGLAPLRGLPLVWLCCWACGIATLEPLRGMPLTALYCDGNAICDLAPLQGMPLGTLICGGNRIESLEPLRGMPLTDLHCAGNRIASLEPLRDLPLSLFSCQFNRIESLAPLRNVPCGALMCGANPLRTLAPFVENPPFSFLFDSDSLPDAELEHAERTWAQIPRCAHHVQMVRVLLALRRNEPEQLIRMAAEFRGRRYLFIPKFMSWDDARVFCERLGGHLVCITSREENNFVNSLLPGGSWFWLGLRTTANGQEWVSGEEFRFSTFVDPLRERRLGEKIFCSGTWTCEVYSGVSNCFMIEWII